jgi:hypothetical protein
MKTPCSVTMCVPPLIVARPRLGIYVSAAINSHATIEEMLDGSFSTWSVS